MRILWISTVVATSWALQVSRYDIRCGSTRRERCPLYLQGDVDLHEVTLLRAKLDILQAVVKELYHKTMMVENDKTLHPRHVSQAQNDEASRVGDLLNENRRVLHLYRLEKHRVATLSSNMESCYNEMQNLKGVLDRKDKDLLRAEASVAAEHENYKTLQSMLETQQNHHRHELLSLDLLAHNEQVKNNEMIEELRALNTEILSLRGKIEACETNCQESTAIASAAVEAAETRNTFIATQLREIERRHKKAQVYCNLQRLVIQGLLEEMQL